MKKKKKIIIIAVCLIIAVLIVSVTKIDSIYNLIYCAKEYVSEKSDYNYRNKTEDVDLSVYENIESDDDAWYSLYSVISHSGGGVLTERL